MNKKFFHFFVLILFSFISQVSANDSQWHLLSSSPSVNVFVNTQQIIYEQGTDTARFWTKSSFPTGDETLMQYEVNYKDKTMLLLTMKDSKTERSVHHLKTPQHRLENPRFRLKAGWTTQRTSSRFILEGPLFTLQAPITG